MKRAFVLIPVLLLLATCLHAQVILPPNMYADTVHAPFLYGVASGDPLADRVILWTKFEPAAGQSMPVTLQWEIASDNAFAQIISSGSQSVDATTDWCLKVDAGNLQPDTRYWYRFRDPQGNFSMTGRTQTAPAPGQSNTQFRAAVISCSSVYSGYFNAYKRIGQRHDLDLVIHLGDYIYDFVDADEEVRVPSPYPTEPASLQEWRDRHAYYLLDPDLRLARARQPWTAIWDNHDLDNATNPDPKQAFYEYLPIRKPDSNDVHRIYRKLSLGNLVDLFLIDVTTPRDIDTLPNGEFSILGDTQWTWLSNELSASTAQWKLIGNERMVGKFSLNGLPGFIPFGDGPVADSGAWDGYNADRDRVLNFLSSNNIHNTVFLSGDIHMSFSCDLAPSTATYDPQTGAGSVAVEFLPTSITRGNFDESGFGGWMATLAQTAMAAANPHHVYEELTSHGYGILDIQPARTVAEYWYSDILQMTNTETFATAFQCLDGQDHWERTAVSPPTTGVQETFGGPGMTVWPNPSAEGGFQVKFMVDESGPQHLELLSGATGQVVQRVDLGWMDSGERETAVSWNGLAPGMYFLRLNGHSGTRVIHAGGH